MIDQTLIDKILNELSGKSIIEPKDTRILVIDSTNTFIRNLAIVNYLNRNGHHVGALTGFLTSLSSYIRIFNPTKVVLVFDGKGGSTNKRYIYPDYKGNRNTGKITNWQTFEKKEDEDKAIENQMSRLLEYLSELPVHIIIEDKIEADDVIGYIVSRYEEDYETKEITIVSSDKDFLQLLSPKTRVYSPTKKKTYYEFDILNEFGVSSVNFINYKILMGDQSDNIPGIKGLGPKKLIKLFPSLSEGTFVSLEEIYNIGKENIEKNDIYNRVVNFKHQLDINKRLMDIKTITISDSYIDRIDKVLDDGLMGLNIQVFKKMYTQDMLEQFVSRDINQWLIDNFNKLK